MVKDGTTAAIMAILEAVGSTSPPPVPDVRDQTGPYVPQKDLGGHIFSGPKIPIPDTPKRAPKFSFDYRGGPQKSYSPGRKIKLTLIPPDNFSSLPGAKRLVIVAAIDLNAPIRIVSALYGWNLLRQSRLKYRRLTRLANMCFE